MQQGVVQFIFYTTSGLDFTPPASERIISDDSPIVVVMHGLTGGAYTASSTVHSFNFGVDRVS